MPPSKLHLIHKEITKSIPYRLCVMGKDTFLTIREFNDILIKLLKFKKEGNAILYYLRMFFGCCMFPSQVKSCCMFPSQVKSWNAIDESLKFMTADLFKRNPEKQFLAQY